MKGAPLGTRVCTYGSRPGEIYLSLCSASFTEESGQVGREQATEGRGGYSGTMCIEWSNSSKPIAKADVPSWYELVGTYAHPGRRAPAPLRPHSL